MHARMHECISQCITIFQWENATSSQLQLLHIPEFQNAVERLQTRNDDVSALNTERNFRLGMAARLQRHTDKESVRP